MELQLFILSALPVFLLGMYIYIKDQNKEPTKLLIKLFIGGILSCFLVLLISLILELLFPIFAADYETLNLVELIVYVFIGIALVEEFSKWIITYKISYNTNSFEEIYDIIVYSVFVSLGFAFFENLLYVYSSGVLTGIIRALLAVPGHACYGVFMGYYLGKAKHKEQEKDKSSKIKNLILSIIIPTIIHGIYDYCLFANNTFFVIIFFIFVTSIYIIVIKKVKHTSNRNIKLKHTNNYCNICGYPAETNYCPMCGNKNK